MPGTYYMLNKWQLFFLLLLLLSLLLLVVASRLWEELVKGSALQKQEGSGRWNLFGAYHMLQSVEVVHKHKAICYNYHKYNRSKKAAGFILSFIISSTINDGSEAGNLV